MDNSLVITAFGNDQPGIVDNLSATIMDSGCNVNDSRITALGGEFAMILLVTGKWNELAKLETQVQGLGEKLGLTISSKRIEPKRKRDNVLTYTVDVVSMDHPGIVYKIANFFSSRNINIRELNTNSYAAAHTGTPMFTMNMIISVPTDIRIATLREDFLDFCDNLNMDAVLEPAKS
ncbi:MAG: glycine cleavage system protein R [Gammaproteobacteria bacterium]|jgi:glycine cleavage system transcriptional repressor